MPISATKVGKRLAAVATARVRDLLLGAKHLFVAANCDVIRGGWRQSSPQRRTADRLIISNYLPNAGHNEGEARQRVFGDELVEVLDQKKKSERTEINHALSPESGPTRPPEEVQKRDRRKINKAIGDATNGHAVSVASARVRDLLGHAKCLFAVAKAKAGITTRPTSGSSTGSSVGSSRSTKQRTATIINRFNIKAP